MGAFSGIYSRVPGLSVDDATAVLGRHWGWMLVAGLAYIALGIFAFAMPVASTFGITIAVAAIFLVNGVIQLVQAIRLREQQGGAMRFFQSILAIAAGALVLFYPGIGMLGISLTLSFYFFISGAFQWMLAAAMGPDRARFWIFANSIASFVLGLFIVFTFPISALWVPGTLLGIDLLIGGASLIGFAFECRRLNLVRQKRAELAAEELRTTG